MIKKISPIVLSICSSFVFAQSSTPQNNSPIEVKAVVDAGCFLTANNINFGVLQMPLVAQTASANIDVKCSKNADFNIAVSYSADGSSYNTTYTAQKYSSGESGASYFIFAEGQTEKEFWLACYDDKKFKFNSGDEEKFKSMFNISSTLNIVNTIVPDTYNICNGRNINISAFSSSSGTLKGLIKQENIFYHLQLPNSTAQWNSSNKFNSKGTGENQVVPMKAIINTASSPKHRLSADTYQDTLTLILTY